MKELFKIITSILVPFLNSVGRHLQVKFLTGVFGAFSGFVLLLHQGIKMKTGQLGIRDGLGLFGLH